MSEEDLKKYQEKRLRKLKQAVFEGVVDYDCPQCGAEIRGEPDADRLWCPVCKKHVEVQRMV